VNADPHHQTVKSLTTKMNAWAVSLGAVLTPAPDGDAWFHARIVIAKPKISVFVNGATEPSLVVNELTDRTGGSIGLWCNGYGLIANLKITPAK
jgi:hypothetical protein